MAQVLLFIGAVIFFVFGVSHGILTLRDLSVPKKGREQQMKLTIFAATGGIGRQVLEQAVAAGHDVTAVVRNPKKLSRVVRIVTADLAAALWGRVDGVCAKPATAIRGDLHPPVLLSADVAPPGLSIRLLVEASARRARLCSPAAGEERRRGARRWYA